MRTIGVVFPHQLLEDNPLSRVVSEFCLIDEKRFFGDFNFHKNKLVFHRASMRAYKDKLASAGRKVHYFSYAGGGSADLLEAAFARWPLKEARVVDVCDEKLDKRITRLARQ